MASVIHTPSAPAAIGPYVQARRAGQMIFTSGQLGLDPQTGALPAGIEAQTRQAMRNVLAILAAAGLGAENIVKTTVFLRDLTDFQTVNALYAEFFHDVYPARSCVEVARLPKDALVEIEAIAAE